MANRKGFGADNPQTFADAFQVRWSRAPDQKKRNYGEVFHSSPAFDALHLIASDLAITEFRLYDKRQYHLDPEKAKEFFDHPILTLLDDPCPGNKELDGFMVRYMTAAYLSMVGEFFWVIERNAKGFPVALYPVLPTWVVQTWSVTFPYYRILPQGVTSAREIIVDGEDIIWFKNPNLVDPFGRGRGRDESIGDEIESDEYAAKYQKNLFFNDGQPPMIISMVDADSAVVENLKETWIQKISGWINARKPMFTNSKVDIQKLTDSVREMDMVESRKALRDIFNQHYAIPPEMRGILEHSNRSTIDSADYLYKKNVLSRAIKRYVDILNRQLVRQFDPKLILVCDDIVPEDELTKKDYALKAFQAGAITENEFRNAWGYAEAPDGDVRLRPANVTMVLAGKGNDKPVVVANPVIPPIKAVNKGFSPDQKKAMWDNFDTKATKIEDDFESIIAKMGKRQGEKFTEFWQAAIYKGKTPNEAIDSAINSMLVPAEDVKSFNAMAPAWTTAGHEGINLAVDTTGIPIDMELVNPVLRQWVKDHGLEMASEINGTTKDYLAAMKQPIADEIAAGASIDKISAMLDAQFERLSTTRAVLIARTETLSSINHGQFSGYMAQGVKEKEWLATQDGNTRADHASADGQKVLIGEPFNVGGAKMLYPGDPAGGPGEVCNCRCTILPVIGD